MQTFPKQFISISLPGTVKDPRLRVARLGVFVLRSWILGDSRRCLHFSLVRGFPHITSDSKALEYICFFPALFRRTLPSRTLTWHASSIPHAKAEPLLLQRVKSTILIDSSWESLMPTAGYCVCNLRLT